MQTVQQERERRVGGLVALIQSALTTGGGAFDWTSKIAGLGIDGELAKRANSHLEIMRELLRNIDGGGVAARRGINVATMASYRGDLHQRNRGLGEVESVAVELVAWARRLAGEATALCDIVQKL